VFVEIVLTETGRKISSMWHDYRRHQLTLDQNNPNQKDVSQSYKRKEPRQFAESNLNLYVNTDSLSPTSHLEHRCSIGPISSTLIVPTNELLTELFRITTDESG